MATACDEQRGRDGSELVLIEPAAGAWAPGQALAVTMRWNGGGGPDMAELPVASSAEPMQAVVVAV